MTKEHPVSKTVQYVQLKSVILNWNKLKRIIGTKTDSKWRDSFSIFKHLELHSEYHKKITKSETRTSIRLMKLKLKRMLQSIVSRHACSHLYKRVVDVHIWLNESSATDNILSFRWRRVPKYNDKHREKNWARKRQHFAHRSHYSWRRHAWNKDAARIAWLHGFEYSLHEVVTCVRSQSIR